MTHARSGEAASLSEISDRPDARLIVRFDAPRGSFCFCLRVLMALFADTVSGDWSKRLSPRECEVAHLAARGLSNKHIARELNLSDGTVKAHVHSIFQKLGVKKRHGLTLLVRAAA